MTSSFNLQYKVDTGLVLNADEFRAQYLFNIPVKGFDGYVIQNDVLENLIKKHTTYVENQFDLKLSSCKIYEKKDYNRTQVMQYHYIPLWYNMKEFVKIQGFLNQAQILDVPNSVVATNTGVNVDRNLYFVFSNLMAFLYTATVYYLYAYSDTLPYFWNIWYIAGFKKLPNDLLDFIGKRALFDAYSYLNNLIYPHGLAGTSKSIDSLSESITTTRTANTTIFGGAKKELKEELDEMNKSLKSIYKGIAMFRV